MPSNVYPLPLVQRYVPGQSMAQDIIGGIEAFECDTHSQDRCGWNYNGPDWFRLNYSPNAFPTPEQLNALTCGNKLSFPAAHPERIRWFDKVHRVDIVAQGEGEQRLFFELVRVPVDQWAMSVVERLATFVRAQPVDGAGAALGPPIILGGNLNNTVLLAVQPPSNISDPCPFPFASSFLDGRELTLTFRAIFTAASPRTSGYDPAFLSAGSGLPIGHPVLSDWSDMRYEWGSRYTENLKLITGQHGWVRVLVAIEVAAGPVVGQGFELEFCTRLSGYTQQAGPAGAAERGALWRI